jgi:hypothetical protein
MRKRRKGRIKVTLNLTHLLLTHWRCNNSKIWDSEVSHSQAETNVLVAENRAKKALLLSK